MRGTDVDQVDLDVGLAAGGDGAEDDVTINGSDAADHVRVSGDGAAVHLAGLHAETSISGADFSDTVRDKLHINTQRGNDTVDVDASATELIDLATDLGAGQH